MAQRLLPNDDQVSKKANANEVSIEVSYPVNTSRESIRRESEIVNKRLISHDIMKRMLEASVGLPFWHLDVDVLVNKKKMHLCRKE